jgi:hypothetical protein
MSFLLKARKGPIMADEKPKWDTPTNVEPKATEAGALALKHGISPDRAQMLIDRLGDDADTLDAAAETLSASSKGKS